MSRNNNLDSYLIDDTLKEKYNINDNDWQGLLQWLDKQKVEVHDNLSYQNFYQDTKIEYYKAINLFDFAVEQKKLYRNFTATCPICGEELALVNNPQKLVKKVLYCKNTHNVNISEYSNYIRTSFSTSKKPYYQSDRAKDTIKIS
jgi:hypothetical protein